MKTKRNKQNKKVRKYGPSSFDLTVFMVGGVIFLSQHPNPLWKTEYEAHYLTWLYVKQGLMATLPKYQNDAEGLADLHGVVRLGPAHPSLCCLRNTFTKLASHMAIILRKMPFSSLFSAHGVPCAHHPVVVSGAREQSWMGFHTGKHHRSPSSSFFSLI